MVGKVQWFGRVIGNHHLGVGEPREVDVLKGTNMSYRRSAVHGTSFDKRLRGSGAQVHNDMAFSLLVKHLGWKLIYDPGLAVDHFPAARFDEDQRHLFSTTAFSMMVHNETLVLLEHLPPVRRVVFGFWALVVGSRAGPGLVQWLRLLPSEGRLAGAKLQAALRGRLEGSRTWRRCGD